MTERDDVFISYAHVDNAALTDGREGWISSFETDLTALLAGRLGARPSVWRDRRLQHEDVFGTELVERVRSAKVLLSILSPRYVQSEWCRRELQTFVEHAQRSGSLIVRNDRGVPKARVVKVLKTHVPHPEHPAEFPETMGVPFYDYDPDEERETPYDQRLGSEAATRYFARMHDLAQSVARLLQAIDKGSQTERVVWLATTTRERRHERDQIARDLADHGFTVLPHAPLPLDDGDAVVEAIQAGLTRAELSLHLVGASVGAVPEGAEHGVVETQLRLANARDDLFQMVHVQGSAQGGASSRGRLMDWLMQEATRRADTDLLQCSPETLKTELLDRLRQTAPEPAVVYLAEVSSDLAALRARVADLLQRHGHEVLPAAPLELTPGYRDRVDEQLRRATHSVHLLGGLYGVVPEAEHQSTVQIQLDRAVELGVAPLTWHAPGAPEARQEALRAAQAPSLTHDEDGLGEALLERLRAPAPQQAADRVVYVLCSERDGPGVDTLIEDLGQVEVRLPESGDAERVRQWHQQCLQDADAVVLWFENGGQRWAHALLQDLRKAVALRGGKPLPVATVRAPGKRLAAQGTTTIAPGDRAGLQAFLDAT